MSRHITVILPDSISETKSEPVVIRLPHPKTALLTSFLRCNDKLYELTAVDGQNSRRPKAGGGPTIHQNKARSLLFSSDWIEGDPTILIATPINVLYFLLPALHQTKARFMTMEDLHDYIEATAGDSNPNHHSNDSEDETGESGDSNVLPYNMIKRETLDLCCDKLDESDTQMYRLSESKLIEHLDRLCDRVVSKAPNALKTKAVHSQLAPVDMTETTPESVSQLGLRQMGVGLICSYLNEPVSKLWLDSIDFAELEEYSKGLAAQRAAALAAQQQLLANESTLAGRKRSAPGDFGKNGKKRPAPVSSASAKNNKSIKSFFAPKK